jgi:phage terminase large subunit-like protein
LNIKLFTPHIAQKRVIDGFADSKEKFGVFVSSRQSGKTILGENLMLYWLLKNPNQLGCWISPVYKQARKVHEELSNIAKDIIVSSNKAEYSITFINGSKLTFLSADSPDSIRGYSFHFMIIDEAAYVNERTISQAILPMLNAIGKKCLMISTPKGRNHFYNYYQKGLDDSNELYISFKARSDENPYSDKDFIEEQRRSLPTDIFKMEYEGAFVDSSNDVFKGLDKVSVVNEFQHQNKSERCFVGVDVGLSKDNTVVCIQSESGRVLYMEGFTGIGVSEASNRVMSILNRYNIAGGYIESNNVGKAVYETVNKRFRKVKAFYTTQGTKMTAVRKLLEDIEVMSVELPTSELCPNLTHEMSSYSYKLSNNGKISFGHLPGQHDDYCDALWLCNEARHSISSKGLYIGGRNSLDVKFGLPN